MITALVLAWSIAWPVDKVAPSIAKLTFPRGACTAFSIAEKPIGTWVTAAHCLAEGPFTLDGETATVVERQAGEFGLAVIESPLKKPALKMGDRPKRGDDVLQFGHGAGGPLIYFPGVLVIPVIEWQGGLHQIVSAEGMPGMSGGPVINKKGRVIGVVVGGIQPTDAPTRLGYGPTWDALSLMVKRYGR